MTRVWRICKQRYRGTAFQGEGARINGGRWNSAGHSVVYTSESAALATLEMLVHIQDPRLLKSFVLIPATVDDALIETLDADEIPANWRQYPAPESTQAVGVRWITDAPSVGLRVPSVIVPGDNILLNPDHPEFGDVEVGDPVDWDHDPRLLGE